MSVSAIIMAGGKGARFGGPGPKCLAPLPDGSTLLSRLLAQLRAAGIDEQIICCSPENAKAFVNQDALAMPCANCSRGPVPALAEALSNATTPWRLLCLADIYFHHSPFIELLAQRRNECLVTGRSGSDAGSGWVLRDGSAVREISYTRPPGADARWTGAFLFHERVAPGDGRYDQQPFEAWLNDLIRAGNSFRWRDAGPFVNVNSFEDYAGLLEIATPFAHEHALQVTARS